jgi:hypothetical protein
MPRNADTPNIYFPQNKIALCKCLRTFVHCHNKGVNHSPVNGRGKLRTPMSGVVIGNCVLETAAQLSTLVTCIVLFESASGYSITPSGCFLNQPVPFVPIIMQIECHSGRCDVSSVAVLLNPAG